jgi:hypothetical protein
MKYYTSTTEFNCGIDLHARQMYVCVDASRGPNPRQALKSELLNGPQFASANVSFAGN